MLCDGNNFRVYSPKDHFNSVKMSTFNIVCHLHITISFHELCMNVGCYEKVHLLAKHRLYLMESWMMYTFRYIIVFTICWLFSRILHSHSQKCSHRRRIDQWTLSYALYGVLFPLASARGRTRRGLLSMRIRTLEVVPDATKLGRIGLGHSGNCNVG